MSYSTKQPLSNKPTIRIIHNLARSGGTLIAKCLGCMDNIALLSEVHPDAQIALSFNITKQAQQWFDYDADVNWQKTDFISSIKHIQEHCLSQQQDLLLRDWSHIDYFGVPVTTTPSKTPALLNILSEHFNILTVQTIRHPIDTWLSTRQLNLVKQSEITPSGFIEGYVNYLQNTACDHRLLYESFLKQPSEELQNICQTLNLQFDATYESKWHQFTHVTGDLTSSSSIREKPIIQPRVRKKITPELEPEIEELINNPAYAYILKIIPEYTLL